MIFEEVRKVHLQGTSRGIILPAIWCRINEIEKGDTLKVIITDGSLMVFPYDKNITKILKSLKEKEAKQNE